MKHAPLVFFFVLPCAVAAAAAAAACIVQSRVAPLARGIKDRVSPMEYKNVCEKSYSYCRRVAATAARASPSTFYEDDGCVVKIFGLVKECCHKISSKNIDCSRRYRELKLKFVHIEIRISARVNSQLPYLLSKFPLVELDGLLLKFSFCLDFDNERTVNMFTAQLRYYFVHLIYLSCTIESFIRRDTPSARAKQTCHNRVQHIYEILTLIASVLLFSQVIY
uniref:Uncharacterized protein n=1 Tax=Trichogramma kaykai TaxID=54128 RepID=A0ABD2XGM9_9HYME